MTGAPILLCQNVTFLSAGGQALVFPWVGFPSMFQQADLLLEVKLVEAGPLDAVLQSSTDTSQPTETIRVTLSAVAVVPVLISSGLRQLVRLVLESGGAASMVVSAWLLPKKAGASPAPTGSITMFGSTTAPTGYVLCDGTSYATAALPALFAVIGYTFGGAGANFNVPDLRDSFPQGVGPFNPTLGAVGGAVSPPVTDPGHAHVVGPVGPGLQMGANLQAAAVAAATGITITDGRPPFLNVHFIIKT